MCTLSFKINEKTYIPQSIVQFQEENSSQSDINTIFIKWFNNISKVPIEQTNNDANNNSFFNKSKNLRYRAIESASKNVLNIVFEKAWERSDLSFKSTISELNHFNNKKDTVNITLKKILLIDCPKIIGNTIIYLHIIPVIYIGFQSYHFLTNFYKNISFFIPNKALPFLVNYCPTIIIQIGNVIASGVSFLALNKMKIIFFSYITTAIINIKYPNIPYISTLTKIITLQNCIELFLLLSPIDFYVYNSVTFIALGSAIELSTEIKYTFEKIGYYFITMSKKNEDLMKSELKNKLQNIWVNEVLSNKQQMLKN